MHKAFTNDQRVEEYWTEVGEKPQEKCKDRVSVALASHTALDPREKRRQVQRCKHDEGMVWFG